MQNTLSHIRALSAFILSTSLAFVNTSSVASDEASFTQKATTANTFTWKNVNIQGMGYVTGLVIHEQAPYYVYARTDVGGVYRYDPAGVKWIALGDKYSRLQSEVSDIESIAIDNVNANRVYKAAPLGREFVPNTDQVSFKGEVHVSNDAGANWTPLGLAAKNVYMGGNDDFRGMTGERLVVDPFDQNRLYFASRKQGLWIRSASGWAQATGIPTTVENPGVTFVIADRSAGALNGRAKTMYAGVYGSGVFVSNDGGANWSPMTGSPNAYPTRATVSPSGALFVSFGGDEGGKFKDQTIVGGLWRFANGAWKNMLPNQNGTFTSVTIDPNNAKNIAVSRGGGRIIFRSADGGENWTEVQKTVVQNEPAYYPKPKASNYNAYVGEWGNAALVYDRAGGAWQTNGFGTIYTPNLNTNAPTWEWRMNGLEELVVRKVKVPPLATVPGSNEKGAELFSVVADMIGFRHASVDLVPTATLGSIDYVSGATSVDFSAQKPEFMAWVGWDQDKGGWWAKRTGYSSDGGKTFTPFANETPGSGGVIAMSATNPQNMVWAPARWAKPHVTFDGGKTWKVGIDVSTGKELNGAFQLSNEWWTGEVLAADRIDGKRFYYLSTGRMYTSADGGATWTPAAKEFWEQGLPPWWTLDTNLVPNPARAGQVFATFASNTNQTESFKMFRSDDFGMTFTAVTTADVVNHMAFGKGDAADKPYMFIHGRVSGATKDGIYRSKDLGATWELVSDPDTNQFAKINTIAADLREKNRVYIGTGGRGIFAGKAADNPNPLGNSRGVNTGGGASANYVADQGFTGGFTFTTDKSVDTSNVIQAAPEAVYRSERFGGNFTYRPLVLAEGRRYLVRLHFAEIWWGVDGKGGASNGAGTRVFNVYASTQRMPEKALLTNFDIFKEAGGANKAIVKEFELYSDGMGNIDFRFEAATNSRDKNAKISGIEFIELGF